MAINEDLTIGTETYPATGGNRMDPATGAALAGGVGNFIGNIMGIDAQRKQQAQNFRDQKHIDSVNYYRQQEWQKNQLTWRALDAKQAGIHPLAAIGANLTSPSPSMIGGMGNNAADVGSTAKDLGQDISRALMAQTSKHDRKLMDLQLNNAQLDNEMKALEVASRRNKMRQAGNPVPDNIKPIASEVISHIGNSPHLEAGQSPTTAYTKGPNGSLIPIPSQRFKEGSEEMVMPSLQWQAGHYLSPAFGGNTGKPPKKLLKKGKKDYEWNVFKGRWDSVKHKGRSPYKQAKDWVKKKYKKWSK